METLSKSVRKRIVALLARRRFSARKIAVAFVFLAFFAVATLVAQRASRVLLNSSVNVTPVERAEGERLFAEKVHPVLKRKCGKCHGEEDARSGLRLDSREGLLCGGHRGPAIAPGSPDHSLLIQSVLQTGDLKMPRRGKLSPEEIQALSEWIKDGAPWPQAGVTSWKEQFEKVVDCVL
jgi:mono/diheme cytochrome c family protein